MEEFTQKEQYWIDKMLKGEDFLTDDISKSEYKLTDGYLNYLDLMIKYGNLRYPEEEYVPTKKVVKINRLIPKEVLNAGNYVYTIFGGVYIVQQVVFARAEHCEALLNKKLNDNENLKEDELLISSFQTITFENGERWCVFLVKSEFTKNHVNYVRSYWTYPYIYDDEE